MPVLSGGLLLLNPNTQVIEYWHPPFTIAVTPELGLSNDGHVSSVGLGVGEGTSTPDGVPEVALEFALLVVLQTLFPLQFPVLPLPTPLLLPLPLMPGVSHAAINRLLSKVIIIISQKRVWLSHFLLSERSECRTIILPSWYQRLFLRAKSINLYYCSIFPVYSQKCYLAHFPVEKGFYASAS